MDNELLPRGAGPTALSPRGGGAVGHRLPLHRAAVRPAARLPHLRPGPLDGLLPLKAAHPPRAAAGAQEAWTRSAPPPTTTWSATSALLAESPFHGEGYRKVWARLRHQGIRTSAERVRRLMREHPLQAPRRGGHAHGPKAHDGTINTERPDEMWGTVRRFIVR